MWRQIAAVPNRLDLIRKLEHDGARLRNKKHVLASTAYEVSSDLDLVVTPQQQNAWLCGEVDMPDAVDRVDDPVLRAAGESKCAALRAHPLGPYAAFLAPVCTCSGPFRVPGSRR
jgi:hypothetical protein